MPFRTDVYMFLFGRKGKEPSHGLGRWYEYEDFNTEYFPCNCSKCCDKLGDGCTIDFPIRLHSKLKWSPTTFIKQDDEQYAQGKELRGSFSSKSSLKKDVRNSSQIS